MKTITTLLALIFLVNVAAFGESFTTWSHGNPVTGNNNTITINQNTQFGDAGTTGQVLEFKANKTTVIVKSGSKLVIYGGIKVTGNNVDFVVEEGAVLEVHEDVVFDNKGGGSTIPELNIDGESYVGGSIKGSGKITGTGTLEVEGDVASTVTINPATGDSVNVTSNDTSIYCAPTNLTATAAQEEDSSWSVLLSWSFGEGCTAPEYFRIKRDNVQIGTRDFLSKSEGFYFPDEDESLNEHSTPVYEVSAVYESGVSSQPAIFSFESSPLPIELLDFSAKANGSVVTINWVTSVEINNDFFTIERSTDARQWEIIGTTYGAGNSNQVLSYTFEDANPLNGIAYYRLKQTDFDGQYEYFAPVVVNMNSGLEKSGLVNVYAQGRNINLSVNNTSEGAMILVSDIQGRVLATQRVQSSDFVQNIALDLPQVNNGDFIIVKLAGNNTSDERKIRVF